MNTIDLAGLQGTECRLHMPGEGVWFADVTLADGSEVAGSVALTIGSLTLRGTVDPGVAGSFADRRIVRVIGGGAGWRSSLPAKAYHNDAGVGPRTVLTDAAREAGETMGSLTAITDRLGVDYVRRAGAASTTLSSIVKALGLTWWVDTEGVTQVGTRALAAAPESVEILTVNTRERWADLKVEDLGALQIGHTLDDPRLEGSATILGLEVEARAERFAVRAYYGDTASPDPIIKALRAFVEHVGASRLYGIYRYRVFRMSADRVELQATSKGAPGLPDMLPISQWPGVAGAHCELTPGTEVLVQFIDGDRDSPVITGYIGKGGAGHVPVSVSFAEGTKPAAGIGDTVDVFFPPSAPISGTLAGSPFSGVITLITPGVGIIKSGNPKVKV